VPRQVDPTSDRPAFKQIADILRQEIQSGALAPGARLPSERELIDDFGSARGTVRQAIALLKSEGLVVTEHGRGGFVRARPPVRRLASNRFARSQRKAGRAAFLAEAEAAGAKPSVDSLHVAKGEADERVAGWLGVSPGDPVLIRQRRYLLDEQPVEFATSYVPWDIAEGTQMTEEDTGPGGIYARIEEHAHPLKRFSEDVRSRMPTPDEVKTLRLGPGVPVFVLLRQAHDTKGRVVEACDTVMAGDRFVLSYELPAK